MKENKYKTSDNQNVENFEAQDSENQQASMAENTTDTMTENSMGPDDKTAEMTDAAAVWQDKYMRLSAEFDNYRKRTLKEKMDLVTTGGEDVIKSLLVVLDDIDRALAVMETASDVESVREGVLLIHQKLMDSLKSRGLGEIEALGLELDTDLHEAVAKCPVPDDCNRGKIVDVVQKGYMLKDKVARHAKVVVGE